MTAVKTEHGMSMLLIPRSDAVETKIIKTAYSSAAGTACVMPFLELVADLRTDTSSSIMLSCRASF